MEDACEVKERRDLDTQSATQLNLVLLQVKSNLDDGLVGQDGSNEHLAGLMPKLKNVGLCGSRELHDIRACNLLACYEGGFGLGVEPHVSARSELGPRCLELVIASWQENVLELNTDKGLEFQDSGLVWGVQSEHWKSGDRECNRVVTAGPAVLAAPRRPDNQPRKSSSFLPPAMPSFSHFGRGPKPLHELPASS